MPENNSSQTGTGLAKSLVLLLSFSNGVVVANMYYSQPLLAEIIRSVNLTEPQAGFIPSMTQIGYGLGLLFIAPLGDLAERRRLIVTLLMLAAGALILTAVAPSALLLLSASMLIGLFSVAVMVIVPLVATLSEPLQRNQNVGMVMSGLLLGILLARTVSGMVGGQFGWRTVYWGGAVLMLCLAGLLRWALPVSRSEAGHNYLGLLSSLPGLAARLPALQEAAVCGALFFASFSIFWTTLVFHLESLPSHLGAQAAGLFGLVGAAGALAATLSGRWADRLGPVRIVMAGAALVLASWLVLWAGGGFLPAMIIGAVFLDLGAQAAHVANQSRIFAFLPEARSRINTIYMVTFFTGGAIGSLAGAYAWNVGGWTAVCLLGTAVMALALILSWLFTKRRCWAGQAAAVGSEPDPNPPARVESDPEFLARR